MWHWLAAEQFTRLDEILFGFGMMFLGLFFEDWIDRFRGREEGSARRTFEVPAWMTPGERYKVNDEIEVVATPRKKER